MSVNEIEVPLPPKKRTAGGQNSGPAWHPSLFFTNWAESFGRNMIIAYGSLVKWGRKEVRMVSSFIRTDASGVTYGLLKWMLFWTTQGNLSSWGNESVILRLRNFASASLGLGRSRASRSRLLLLWFIATRFLLRVYLRKQRKYLQS